MRDLIESFNRTYQNTNEKHLYYAPGRVNLIGEYIDFNGGFVFPAAISLGTYGVYAKREDNIIRLFSKNLKHKGILEFRLDDLNFNQSHDWANFAKGVFYLLKKEGHLIPFGFDLYIYGTLPTASGLSSSASLELLILSIANDLYQLNLSKKELAVIGRKVENEYMGAHTGIMDQLIIACGIKDHALLMNTATLEVKPTKADFEGYKLVIMNTNYKRKLTDSKYNDRRKDCDDSLAILKKHFNIEYLCELGVCDLPKVKELLNNDLLYQRTRHVITEQNRTIQALEAMKKEDIKWFGTLLNQSHESLKNDFEVTGLHLDVLQEKALEAGAIGARVTGAGFGGCAICYVKNEQVESLKQYVYESYLKITGLEVSFYEVKFTDGAGEIKW
jgi:galactokinase